MVHINMPVNIQVHVAMAVIHIFLLSHSYYYFFLMQSFSSLEPIHLPVGKKSEKKKKRIVILEVYFAAPYNIFE